MALVCVIVCMGRARVLDLGSGKENSSFSTNVLSSAFIRSLKQASSVRVPAIPAAKMELCWSLGDIEGIRGGTCLLVCERNLEWSTDSPSCR